MFPRVAILINMLHDGTHVRLIRNYVENRMHRYNPSSMEIAVHYACNLRCRHCNTTTIKEASALDFETLKRAFSEFDRLGGVFVTLTGGEPTPRKDLPEIVGYIKNNTRLRVSIVTNGTLLDGPLLVRLKEAGLDNFLISLYGDRHHHNRFTAVENSYDKTLAGIRSCLKEGIATCLLTVPTRETLQNGSFTHIRQLSKSLDVPLRINLPTCSGRVAEGQEGLLDQECLHTIYDFYKTGDISTDSTGFFSQRRCPSTLSAFYVTAYGDVTPCPFIQFSFGNIAVLPLMEIFRRISRSGYNKVAFSKYQCPPAEDEEFINLVVRKIYQYEKVPVDYQEFRELSNYLNSR